MNVYFFFRFDYDDENFNIITDVINLTIRENPMYTIPNVIPGVLQIAKMFAGVRLFRDVLYMYYEGTSSCIYNYISYNSYQFATIIKACFRMLFLDSNWLLKAFHMTLLEGCISLVTINRAGNVSYRGKGVTKRVYRLLNLGMVSGFKKAYELVNLAALKSSILNKLHIFLFMGEIFLWSSKCTFQIPLKYLTDAR